MKEKRHEILFEPLQIGPVTTKNRFYQVPHCTGMGWRRPKALAAMRGVKAEGGWGVVCTEYCSIHPTSDDDSYPFASLWDEGDIRSHRLMTGKVHEHGALAGVELWIGGGFVSNMGSRIPALGLQDRPATNAGVMHPGQPRKMDRQDIREIRRWHRDAARRAVEADFDIVYVYANHGYLLSQFLDAATNERGDEYGGSLQNRTRIVRELIEETREAVAGKAAVATRFSVGLDNPETYDTFGQLADLPDLWDLTVPDYDIEMGVSRFVKEAAQETSVARARSMTDKPIVAVGRFTSPDTMAQTIRSGVQDLIGAARPSIADPYLPKKIEEGRFGDIRECIGCNICYAHNALGVPVRCTQNPTMGEEWRLGWHPERVTAAEAPAKVLVIGSGPAGLEAARVLGERGHTVTLAEARREVGGRVTREARLPGLSEWARVRDWRLGQIDKLDNVEIFPENPMTAKDCLVMEADHILIATGAKWAADAVGRYSDIGFDHAAPAMLVGAEQVIDGGCLPAGDYVIYDDDHYYMGSVLALQLRKLGHGVRLVTTVGRAGAWMSYTEEIYANSNALIAAGVEIETNLIVTRVEGGTVTAACVFGGPDRLFTADHIIPVTRRLPELTLYNDLVAKGDAVGEAGVKSVRRIGDAEAPHIIAAAVHSGYRAAMELGEEVDLTERYGRRERPGLTG